jgi:uncharacterized protein YeaO (DUF488 family)
LLYASIETTMRQAHLAHRAFCGEELIRNDVPTSCELERNPQVAGVLSWMNFDRRFTEELAQARKKELEDTQQTATNVTKAMRVCVTRPKTFPQRSCPRLWSADYLNF